MLSSPVPKVSCRRELGVCPVTPILTVNNPLYDIDYSDFCLCLCFLLCITSNKCCTFIYLLLLQIRWANESPLILG